MSNVTGGLCIEALQVDVYTADQMRQARPRLQIIGRRCQSYLISLHLVAADLTARDCGALGTRIIMHVFVVLNIHVQLSKSQIEQKEIFYAPLPLCFPDWAAVTTTMPAPKFKVALIQMCPKVRSDQSTNPAIPVPPISPIPTSPPPIL